jgi:hypothetical protein
VVAEDLHPILLRPASRSQQVIGKFGVAFAAAVTYISCTGLSRHPVRRPIVQALRHSLREERAIMDEGRFSISASDLYRWLGTAAAPLLIDVRRGPAFEALREIGAAARYLEGGIAAWAEAELPRRHKLAQSSASWVTRERPKIDRIACPWLIRRFIDPEASFLPLRPDRAGVRRGEVDRRRCL